MTTERGATNQGKTFFMTSAIATTVQFQTIANQPPTIATTVKIIATTFQTKATVLVNEVVAPANPKTTTRYYRRQILQYVIQKCYTAKKG